MKGGNEHSVDSSNVVYVSEQLDVKDAALEAFSDVFARFQLPPDDDTVSFPPIAFIKDYH